MDDIEFQALRNEIHQLIFRLIELQKLHNNETGQDYIVRGPMRPSRLITEFFEQEGIDA